MVQSTESSNCIEAIVAPSARIAALVRERTTPRDRSEQEIAGYRDVRKTIHAHHADTPFTRTLYALRDEGPIRCLGKGRDASWERLR